MMGVTRGSGQITLTCVHVQLPFAELLVISEVSKAQCVQLAAFALVCPKEMSLSLVSFSISSTWLQAGSKLS